MFQFCFRVGLLFINFSSFKPVTENSANFENYKKLYRFKVGAFF